MAACRDRFLVVWRFALVDAFICYATTVVMRRSFRLTKTDRFVRSGMRREGLTTEVTEVRRDMGCAIKRLHVNARIIFESLNCQSISDGPETR